MNPWGLLSREIVDRPGTAYLRRGGRPRSRTKPHVVAPPKPRAPRTEAPALLEHLEARQVDDAHERVPNPWHLPPRLLQVLGLAVQGLGRASIAERLQVTTHTATQYLSELRRHMEVDTTSQAILAWHRFYRVIGPQVDEEEINRRLALRLSLATAALRAARNHP